MIVWLSWVICCVGVNQIPFKEFAVYGINRETIPTNIAVIEEILPIDVVVVCYFDCLPSDASLVLSHCICDLYIRGTWWSSVDPFGEST